MTNLPAYAQALAALPRFKGRGRTGSVPTKFLVNPEGDKGRSIGVVVKTRPGVFTWEAWAEPVPSKTLEGHEPQASITHTFVDVGRSKSILAAIGKVRRAYAVYHAAKDARKLAAKAKRADKLIGRRADIIIPDEIGV